MLAVACMQDAHTEHAAHATLSCCITSYPPLPLSMTLFECATSRQAHVMLSCADRKLLRLAACPSSATARRQSCTAAAGAVQGSSTSRIVCLSAEAPLLLVFGAALLASATRGRCTLLAFRSCQTGMWPQCTSLGCFCNQPLMCRDPILKSFSTFLPALSS